MPQKLEIILSWIELERVILVRYEILVLIVKSVSGKAELEILSYIWDFSTKHWVRKTHFKY